MDKKLASGFLPLDREKVFNHPLWESKEAFSKREAFLDLLRMAAFKPQQRIVDDKVFNIEVGEIVASERFLQTRWKWNSRTKVRKFLLVLESLGDLTRKKDQGQTVITVCKYNDYTCRPNEKEPQRDHGETGEEPEENRRETKDKNSKKGKNSSVETPAIAWSPTDGWSEVADQDLEEWRQAYPACNIERQLSVMNQWLKSNPAKAKKKLWRRFITNWLSRSQEKGGDLQGQNGKNIFAIEKEKKSLQDNKGPEGWENLHRKLYELDPPEYWGLLEWERRNELTEQLKQLAI